MAFAKKSPKFYTGKSRLQYYCKKVVENINSTPAQQLEALRWLLYLAADTELEQQISRLNILTFNGGRIGYKVPAHVNIADGEQDGIKEMVKDMLDTFKGVKSELSSTEK
jgi:hypothetical protein